MGATVPPMGNDVVTLQLILLSFAEEASNKEEVCMDVSIIAVM
jgi:hypothetical protein